MTNELDPNFKRVFSFELLLHRIENNKAECAQYTKILLEKSLAGLVAQGKISISYNKEDDVDYIIEAKNGENTQEIAEKLTIARKIYKDLAEKMGSARSDATGRSYMDGQILGLCHKIDAVIYPIAMEEKLLDMSVTLNDFAAQFAQAQKDQDEE